MSEWKVFADHIEIFPHPNANKMELGRIGTFQVVVGKGLYKTGDLVVFAPKRSVLPVDLRPYFVNEETGRSYLKGVNYDRVGSIRLRGEESEGVILPPEWVGKFKSLQLQEDLSEQLGIYEYIPEIHNTSGKRKYSPDFINIMKVDDAVHMDRFVRHDVEQFRIFEKYFIPLEHVIVTEKLHGSQISVMKDAKGNIAVTSKGRAEKNFVLREYPRRDFWHGRGILRKLKNLYKAVFHFNPEMNEYWRVAHQSGLIKFVSLPGFEGQEIQVVGEVVPYQNGFHYGFSGPTVKVFRVILNTNDLLYGAYDTLLDWVPVLYNGPYILDSILPLIKGNETVSGKGLHIKEGGVLSPVPLRRINNTPLLVKLINPAFKDTNDDIR